MTNIHFVLLFFYKLFLKNCSDSTKAFIFVHMIVIITLSIFLLCNTKLNCSDSTKAFIFVHMILL